MGLLCTLALVVEGQQKRGEGNTLPDHAFLLFSLWSEDDRQPRMSIQIRDELLK